MTRTILDCYTDEPAGLGVPPFIGVWPRYAAGWHRSMGVPPMNSRSMGVPPMDSGAWAGCPCYLTIDDLRLVRYVESVPKVTIDPPAGRTHIEVLNHTRPYEEIKQVLANTEELIIVVGVQTPGKYLSARPGTLREVGKLLSVAGVPPARAEDLRSSMRRRDAFDTRGQDARDTGAASPSRYPFRTVLTGPVLTGGTQFRGGARPQLPEAGDFDELHPLVFDTYEDLQPHALAGARLITQMPRLANRIVELETGRGCPREKGCSFCTEPIKQSVLWRRPELVIEEAKALMALGARALRLGKQSCIYSYEGGGPRKLETLLAGLAALKPTVLHIDNANPAMIDERRTELFVKYLTPGSTAAMGIESFDPEVTKANNLNCPYDLAFEAIRTVNRLGGQRGENGCHALLPGINILLGLAGETPETLDRNFAALKRIFAEGLLIRRINIRRVVPFPGTPLYEQAGQKYLRRNQRLYTPWIEKVRQEIDIPMLQKLFPVGTVLKDLCSEVHNGGTTFMRQIGSYPIVVAVWERLPLNEFFNVRVVGYRRRSLLAERIH
ncbi:MAG: radical SAM protein [Planctomycetes bacterium]|nr:radical SAM protein [Planctomycetota bacterium]